MSAASSPPDLTVLIVNYNGGAELLACLQSLADSSEFVGFEVIIIDNASTDESFESAQQKFPGYTYLSSGENAGFARANNIGLKQARGRHVMLLNPDTEIESGCLSKLVSELETHADWGIVGPRMLNASGRPYRAARRFPTPQFLFYEQTGLSKLFRLSQKINGYVYGGKPLHTIDEVDQIEGSALMIRREALDAVGELDEQFYIFFEEVDWCRRVKDAGFEVHVVRDASVRHHQSTSMSKHYVRIRQVHANSAMRYFRKHHGEAGLKQLRRNMIRALRIRRALTYVHMIFGGFGKAKLRAAGATAELAVYKRGLPG